MGVDGDFSRLTERIYEAGSLGAEWPVVLGEISGAIGGVASVLFNMDTSLQPQDIGFQAVYGYSAADQKAYQDYYISRDLRMKKWGTAPLGVVFAEERDAPFSEFETSEIFNDFFRPIGAGHGIGARLFDDTKRFGMLSVHRELNLGAFHEYEVSLFQNLIPHIIRALQLQRQLKRAEVRASALAFGLDHFQLAVFLIAADHKVIELNAAAIKLLQTPNCPIVLKNNRLQSKQPAVESLVKAQLTAAFAAQTEISRPPPIFWIKGADGTSQIDGMAVPQPPGLSGGAVEPMVLLFMSDRSTGLDLKSSTIMQQYRFTVAEAEVAKALVKGMSVEAISDQRAVSRETIRAQVKSIQGKTETRSQGQLIALMSRGLSALNR